LNETIAMNSEHSAFRASSVHRLAIPALLLIACGVAHAAPNCVDTSQALQAKLNEAASQTGPYIIRVVASATPYELGLGNDSILVPPTMTLRGGYLPGCDSNQEDASGTVIDFGGYPVGFDQANTDVPNLLKFSNLTLQHGVGFSARAGSVHGISDEPGEIDLENVRFTDFTGPSLGSPITLRATKGLTQLVNVQFDSIQQSHFNCAVWIEGDNNSFLKANFVTADLTGWQHFCLIASTQPGTFQARIDNSIIWGSDGGTPRIRGMDPSENGHDLVVYTTDSIYHPFAGWGTIHEENHLDVDPHWLNPSAADYRLAGNSQAVNSGTEHGELGAPHYDIDHGLRTVGSVPDRGAHESPFSDSTVLVVTSGADSGPQTLRDAISVTNQIGGQHTIQFDLPACPTVISLATPLPYITSGITIDGFSQAGSAPNRSEESFDATLCVLVKPATSAVAAFRVPTNANGGATGSLKLQGLGIGGFGQSVILLGSGTHTILGNQFGGVANGVDLGPTSSNIIAIGGDAANGDADHGGSVTIGGFGPENRNLIDGAGGGLGNGVNVQSGVTSIPGHCVIYNNWIGLAPDLTPLPNTYGVQLSGSGCQVINNRISASTTANIWINGGHDNAVLGNIISDTSGLPNNAFGIRIDGEDNLIGATDLLGSANAITDMSKGGIVVLSGSGNSVRGNYVAWNGPNHDGLGMDIDLGGDGPTGNQDHMSAGPNNWQPFPEINGLALLAPPAGSSSKPASIEAHLEAVVGSYQVDAYLSGECASTTGRPHAEVFLGSTAMTIPAGQTGAGFVFQVLLPANATGYLGLTATDGLGNTSEIGTCYSLDRIFESGFGTGADY
jgi:hypothetical protein